MNVALAVAVALALVASYLQAAGEADARALASANRPVEQVSDGYVSSRQCRSCHPQQYDSWFRSYHRTMTTPATPEHVFGDFDDVVLKQDAQELHLRREGERFMVRILEPAHDAEGERLAGRPPVAMLPPGDVELAMITGSHHMQVYWYETGHGRALGQLPFAYLKEEQRWIPRRMAFLRPPSKFRPAETGRWNGTCIHCHSTHGQPRPGPDGKLDTRVAELGIACEACHGPGRKHVARFTSPVSRYSSHVGDAETDTIVDPRELDHERASQICSQCHALWQLEGEQYERWAKHGFAYRPGDDPEDTMYLFSPSRAEEDPRVKAIVQRQAAYTAGQYWSDGQARVSGREYNGMADSACFTDGELSCMSCHRMHKDPADPRSHAQWANDQLGEGMDSDRACLQCHQELGGSDQAITAHTRHAPGSSGSRCYNCHMPYTSYGLLKAIRSHKITNPSAEETAETGRPNACNMCHLDRSLQWTAEALRTRFGVDQTLPTHARAVEGAAGAAAARSDRELALSVEHALRGDAAQRALMAWAFGWQAARQASGERWMPAFLGILMDDPYDAVRFIAHRSLRSHGTAYRRLDYDFVRSPAEREPIAPAVAALAGPHLQGPPPPQIPLGPSGQPGETVEALLQERDHTPINLLE